MWIGTLEKEREGRCDSGVLRAGCILSQQGLCVFEMSSILRQ